MWKRLSVGLEVGTFSLESDVDGRFSVFHAGLTNDWTTGARVQLEAEEAKAATNKCSSLFLLPCPAAVLLPVRTEVS